MKNKTVEYRQLETNRTVSRSAEDLLGADLRCTDFSHGYYPGLNLRRANLSFAQFTDAYLECANLSDVTAHKTVFFGAKLYCAAFQYADLRGSNFMRANLSYAILRGAALHWANFTDADITGAQFENVDGLETCIGLHWPQPTEDFVGYKVIRMGDSNDPVIAELYVPAEARRVRGLGSDIIRVDRAIVKQIYTPGSKPGNVLFYHQTGRSLRDPDCIYTVGKMVTPHHAFDTDIRKVCGSGIHLYATEAEAKDGIF